MFLQETQKMSELAYKKVQLMKETPVGYFFLSMLAGAYVGFGIVLIFSIGGPVQSFGQGIFSKVIMGASFGIALSLVVFAGSELFTGNNLVGLMGRLNGTITRNELLTLSLVCFFGNLAGSFLLAEFVVQANSFVDASKDLILKYSYSKMNAEYNELFFRGILCNWLVCLAIWVCGRTQSDVAKLILIFWCLFAFIASGFEHCVANMTLLSIGLLLPHGAEISISGMGFNLFWVTLGNMVGGMVFVSIPYWFTQKKVA